MSTQQKGFNVPDELEKVSIKKWLQGFLNPITWSKSMVYIVMAIIFLFVCVTIYRAYIMKTQQQKTSIRIEAGGTANITNVQQSDKKRPWWLPIPYISAYGEARNSARNKLSDIQYGYGAQAGFRIDF